ncbi:uncharacterized protein LOC131931020 [Physella acuta]|uniref:uncharacterized protein LOC131931020 n=1 Tax=Physella acuta TaxID=109671 RepID=UPI0027DC4CBB|nr:uncharacterized protein LOC131931020 [Physella acuta]
MSGSYSKAEMESLKPTSSNMPQKADICCSWMGRCLCFVSFALLAVLIPLVVLKPTKSSEISNRTCIECSKLVPHKHSDFHSLYRTLIIDTQGEVDMCCADNEQQLSALRTLRFHIKLKERDRVIHSVLESPRNALVKSQRQTLYNQESEVKYTGMYLVYINANFCHQINHRVWSATVTRRRPGDDRMSGAILTTRTTCCDNCTTEKQTSFTGAVFVLHKHDVLNIVTSPEITHINSSLTQTFGFVPLFSV